MLDENGYLSETDKKLIREIRGHKKIREEEKDVPGDPPQTLSGWMASTLTEDTALKPPSEAKVGEMFIWKYRGKVIDGGFTRTEVQMPQEKGDGGVEKKVFIPKIRSKDYTYAVYEIFNPSQIKYCKWGYRSERYDPQVFDGSWRKATNEECRGWANLPVNKRRVVYVVGVLPDDAETGNDYVETDGTQASEESD